MSVNNGPRSPKDPFIIKKEDQDDVAVRPIQDLNNSPKDNGYDMGNVEKVKPKYGKYMTGFIGFLKFLIVPIVTIGAVLLVLFFL